MVKLANNIAAHGGFANPFDSLATGLTASNPPLYPLLLAGFVRLFGGVYPGVFAASIACILVNAVTAALLPR